MRIVKNMPLQKYNSFGIDVDAAYFAEVETTEGLIRLYNDPLYKDLPKLQIGNACNILFLDDYSGMIVRMQNKGIEIIKTSKNEVYLRVQAGEEWDDLVYFAAKNEWWGLENLVAIPGLVGSAPVQNIGAYGVELKDVFVSAQVWNIEKQILETLSKEECKFDYRDSIFKGEAKGKYIIFSVDFCLRKQASPCLSYGDLEKVLREKGIETPKPKDIIALISKIRSQKLPDVKSIGSAGSFFQNPIVDELQYDNLLRSYPDLVSYPHKRGRKLSAAWLIEQCAWKAFREGDAGVYPMQSLVLVNYGNASGKDIYDLAKRIQQSVYKKFGVCLETEVLIIGDKAEKIDCKYADVLENMFTCLPMFQRIGASAYKPNLDNTWALMEALRHPEKRFKSIHIAGTNGKGSSSHLLASVFQEAGYKTGLYTSPHLKDFRERIKINGECIGKEDVIDFYEENKALFDKVKASFFEMTVAMAFDYFAKERVDIAIVEVGMGGRLDSTNVIRPELSVITNISLDHTQFLGDSIVKIAEEKAGIIKENVSVVVGETQLQTSMIFTAKAKEKQSSIYFADTIYSIVDKSEKDGFIFDVLKKGTPYIQGISCALLGTSYQSKNVLTVICAIDILMEKYDISLEDVKRGFAKVIENTALLGRWQCLSTNPLTICDTGHNEAGMRLVLKQIGLTPHKKLHFVIGMVNDKDIDKILSLLPTDAIYYFCKADIPRGLEVDVLAKQAHAKGLRGQIYDSVKAALEAAKTAATEDDLVFVGGSTFVVAEVC